MRILHLDTAMHWGAGQNQVRLLMREFRERALEQLCVTPSGSQLEARLRAEGLAVQGVPHSRGPGFQFARAVMRLARGVDVIHAHDTGALTAARWAARIRAVHVVAGCREMAPDPAIRWGDFDRVIAISDAVRSSLAARSIDPGRVRMIHSGVDQSEIKRLERLVPTLRDRLGFERQRFLAGAIGSLHGFRHYELVPQAAARAREIGWTIVGEGPRQSAIEAAIAAHGVEENVRTVGRVADPRRALLELDVLVSPAEGEALGAGILEAMVLDVPVVAADDAGPAEILQPVQDQTGAVLIPAGDGGALADAVRRLERDPALRTAVIASQRKRLAGFTARRTAEATIAVYRELIEGGE